MYAGEHEAAAKDLREGFETLSRLGEKAYLSSVAALLAEALHELGRDEEAEGFTRISEENAAPMDLAAQIQWRMARTRIVAGRGDLAEAERLARDAVRLSEETEFLDMRADALLRLAETLEREGRATEAGEAARSAVALYERKGYRVRVEKARRLVERLAG
jgi:hypothetical protein